MIPTIINRHQSGHDGKTPHSRIYNKHPNELVVKFCEQVLCKHIPSYERSNRKQSLASKWRKGTWVGIDVKSGMHVIILRSDVAVRVRTIKRRPDIEKWDADVLLNITCTPKVPNANKPGNNRASPITKELEVIAEDCEKQKLNLMMVK